MITNNTILQVHCQIQGLGGHSSHNAFFGYGLEAFSTVGQLKQWLFDTLHFLFDP